MEMLRETENEDVFDIIEKMDDGECFHIFVDDGVIDKMDEDMEDQDGNPMVWEECGNNMFEHALFGYAKCYGKLSPKIIARVLEKQYADAIKLLGIKNILTFYCKWGETIILKDYCFCSKEYLERFHSNCSYFADNENSQQCKKW